MGAFLRFPARPLGLARDADDLRSFPTDALVRGTTVQIVEPSILAFWTYRWDPEEVAADDGQRFLKPNSITHPAPGRWIASGSTEALPSTFVLRDSSGLSAVVPVAPLTLTYDTAANNTTPTILTLRHTTSHVSSGANGMGSGLAFEAEAAGGVVPVAGSIVGQLTNATAPFASRIVFSALAAGVFGEAASISGAGDLTTSRLLAPKHDVPVAGALSIGVDLATSIVLGKAAVHTSSAGNLTAANLLTDGGFDRATAGPSTLWSTNASSGVIGKAASFDLTARGSSVTIKGHKPIGDASGAVTIWAAAGTQTNGYLLAWGDGVSFTHAGGIAFDGVAEVCVGRPTGIKSADHAAKFWEIVECSPPGPGMTVTLPNPTGHFGKPVWVKINGTTVNNVTITTPSGTIDNAASKVVTGAWPAVMLISYGANGYYAFPHLT